MNEAAHMPSDSNAVNVNTQSKNDVLQIENLGNAAVDLNHLETLSWCAPPRFAICNAQQEALYREHLQAQRRYSDSDQRVEQASS